MDPRDCKECVPPMSPRRQSFWWPKNAWYSSARTVFSVQTSAHISCKLILTTQEEPLSPPQLALQPALLHPHMNYCQSTPNALSTADLNHVEELMVPVEQRMCLYNSKNWAISMAEGVVLLWL